MKNNILTKEDAISCLYDVEDIEFGWFFRMNSKLKAFFGAKNMFREFCQNSGVDFPIIENKKYVLPKEYTMKHARLEDIGNLRDKIIISARNRYDKQMARLETIESKNTNDIQGQESFIEDCESKLKEDTQELKSTKDALMTITLEGRIGNLTAKIENQKRVLAEMVGIKEQIEKVKKQNKANWQRQLEIIKNVTRNNSVTFCTSIGRKIIYVFSFDNFKYVEQAYADSVKAILGEK